MKNENEVAKVVYIMVKSGTPYKIYLTKEKQYKVIKEKIKKCKAEFVEIVPTLDIKKSEIVSIEYVEETYKKEKTNEGEN